MKIRFGQFVIGAGPTPTIPRGADEASGDEPADLAHATLNLKRKGRKVRISHSNLKLFGFLVTHSFVDFLPRSSIRFDSIFAFLFFSPFKKRPDLASLQPLFVPGRQNDHHQHKIPLFLHTRNKS